MSFIAATPKPPYYAVIFTAKASLDSAGYAEMASDLEVLVQSQKGFLGLETLNDAEGHEITVSYWEDESAIKAWKAVPSHQVAQDLGKTQWYKAYHIRVAKVERDYGKSL